MSESDDPPYTCYVCSTEFLDDEEEWWKYKCDQCNKYICREHRHNRIEYDDGAVCPNCVKDMRCQVCDKIYAKCYETCTSWTGCLSCHRLVCSEHMIGRRCVDCSAKYAATKPLGPILFGIRALPVADWYVQITWRDANALNATTIKYAIRHSALKIQHSLLYQIVGL